MAIGDLKPFYCLILGPSGSGTSSALDSFSDYGFMLAGDIKPERFAETFYSLRQHHEHVVFTIGLRPESQHHLAHLLETLKRIKQEYADFKILYLDAPEHVLIQRYLNSGKTHVFDEHIEGGLQAGVQLEKRLFSQFKPIQDYSIDTSTTTPGELKGKIAKILGLPAVSQTFALNIVSFGYKYGIPQEAELVFDMRFIKNPFYEDALREQTGLDQPVKDYIFGMPHTQMFFKQWSDLVALLLPHYQEEGKSRLTLAVGCTGGKHRSVCMAEALAESLRATFPTYRIKVNHREVFRWSSQTLPPGKTPTHL